MLGLCLLRNQLDKKLHDTQQKLEKTQEEEKEAKETLKVIQQNFTIMDGAFTRVVEEMKNVAIRHEETLTTTLVRHKEEMQLVTECLKKVEHKFLEMQTEKETQHAKCLSFELEVQMFKE